MDLAADARQEATRVSDRLCQPARKRIIERGARHELVRKRHRSLLAKADLAVIHGIGVIVAPGCPEQVVAAAQDRLGIQRPRSTDPRRKFRFRGIALIIMSTVDIRIAQPTAQREAYQSGKRADDVPVERDRKTIVPLLQSGFVLVAEPEIQGEVIARADVVLHVASVRRYEDLERSGDSRLTDVSGIRRRQAEQEAREPAALRVTRPKRILLRPVPVEVEETAGVAEAEIVHGHAAETAAEFHRVPPEELRQIAVEPPRCPPDVVGCISSKTFRAFDAAARKGLKRDGVHEAPREAQAGEIERTGRSDVVVVPRPAE